MEDEVVVSLLQIEMLKLLMPSYAKITHHIPTQTENFNHHQFS